MEMNPFTLDSEGAPFPLDMRGELDDTAAFKSGKKWGTDLEFPLPFGRSMSSAEEYIHSLDGKTGASLKLSILNPQVCLLTAHCHRTGTEGTWLRWGEQLCAPAGPRSYSCHCP